MNNESTLIIIPFSAGWDSTLTALQVLCTRRKIIKGEYAESEGDPLFSENLVIRLSFVKSGNSPKPNLHNNEFVRYMTHYEQNLRRVMADVSWN